MNKKLKALWKDRKNQGRYMRWLMHYTKPYAWKIALLLLIGLGETFVSVWMVDITKNVQNNAVEGKEFKTLLISYLVLIVALQVVGVVTGLLSTMLNEHFSFGIRKQVYEQIINSHWMDVKRYHTGDLMTRLTSDAGAIADGIIGTIPQIITQFATLIVVFIYLFNQSPLLAIFALLIAPVAAILAMLLGKRMKKLQVKVQESESDYRSFLQESLANLLIVKTFANEKYSADKLTELRENRFHWVFKKTKLSIAMSTVMSTTFQLGYIVAFSYGVTQLALGKILIGTMTAYLTLINRVQAPIIALSQQVPRIVSILASAGRIMELQNIPLEKKLPEHMDHGTQIGVSVQDVTFGYLPQETVLEGVSLDIKPGEFVVIVGESGIGKTTLLRLIMSFMSDYKGNISFYNTEGGSENANAGTREFISYVPQGNTLFSGTIRENIRMGNLNATTEEMYEALRLAAGYDFVMELPQQIDTRIGERGHGISEGQAQRIAIARAFVRHAPFLILDEATSALDEETEQKVIQGLQELTPRPTCLIVTHRRSIIKYCDREIKIQNKEMAEVPDEFLSMGLSGMDQVNLTEMPFVPDKGPNGNIN